MKAYDQDLDESPIKVMVEPIEDRHGVFHGFRLYENTEDDYCQRCADYEGLAPAEISFNLFNRWIKAYNEYAAVQYELSRVIPSDYRFGKKQRRIND